MPINEIQIKRSSNATLSSPSSVVLKDGELFWMRPSDSTTSGGKLYVGDGSTNMKNLRDVGYADRKTLEANTDDISDIKSKIGNWDSSTPITSTIQRDETKIDNNTSNIAKNTSSIENLSNLLTSNDKGIYFPTTDGKLPSVNNTSINIGNVFLAMNSGVSSDFNWDSNINLDNPGEWKSGNKDATLLHNSKVYGLDARVGKIFDNKFGEKGIFGKDFIIYKTVGGSKQKVLEFIRSDNYNDTARIGGGEVTYGTFEGQQKAHLQGVNIKGSTISESYLSNSTMRGTISVDGVTLQARSERVKIINPSIDNPVFTNGFINKYDYFQPGIVDTNALKDGSVTAAKLASGAIQASKILGKSGKTSILCSDASGNVYWGDAPNTSGAVSADGSYTNYLAYFKSGKTISGKIAFSSAKTNKYLNENGTWSEVGSTYCTTSTAGIVKPADKDFVVGTNGSMAISRTSKMASSIAILTQYEGSVPTDQTLHYFGKISNDGKTLTFIRAYV